jgi:PAS domain S-box-containing protein
MEPFDVQSLLAVPLVSKDRVIGLMVLDHTEEDRRFSQEQIGLAATIGTQVSIAIENARLYEETIEEKVRTETILEEAFSGIMVIDAQGRIVTVNHEVEVTTGYASQELLGGRLTDLFGPDLLGESSPLSTVMATGERVAAVESTLLGRNGARDILLGVTPIREGYLLNFADITRLKDVDRLKSNIVANVSHELRAPLASIKAYVELLLDNLEGDDTNLRHRFLSIIDQETDWLTELINDLLDLSRLESEPYSAEKDLLSMSEIVESVVALLDIQVHKKGIAVRCEVANDLPLVMADKELMTILVKNLVSNAIKYSAEGGRIDIVVRKTDSQIILEVADQGIGIPPEDLPHLFTKFYRSGIAKEHGIRGTGLGLVLAKEAVDIHGGTIKVDSQLGVGTRVIVGLPEQAESAMEIPRQVERIYE